MKRKIAGANTILSMILMAILLMSVLTLSVMAAGVNVNPIEVGRDLGTMTTSCVLGVVSVVCVLGILLLYKDKQKDNEEHRTKLYTLIENATKASESQSASNNVVAGVLVEVKDAIKECRKNG